MKNEKRTMKNGTPFTVIALIAIIALALAFSACEGPAGPQGIAGLDGKNGLDGKDGKDGLDGQDGTPGADGQNGTKGDKGDKGDQGETGSGAKGDKGDKGDQGETGVGTPGQPGQPGAPAAVMTPLWLGTFPIILEDRTAQLPAARIDLIQDMIAEFTGDNLMMGNLTVKGNSNMRIIIEDAPAYEGGANYRVVDWRTYALRYEFAATATNQQLASALRNGMCQTVDTPLN